MNENGNCLLAVIVTMNSESYMRACLSSLFAALPQNFPASVVVVDNCSADKTVEIIAQEYPQVRMMINQKPCGLSENNNRGIRAIPSDFYLILNPDTRIPPDTIEKLLNFMETHPEAGICAPQLVFPDGRIQESVRKFPSPLAVLARGTVLKEIGYFKRLHEDYILAGWDHDQVAPVDWVLGACMLIRGQALQEIGLMDEGYRLYYEEIDYCYRAQKAGWQVYYYPQAQVVHDYRRESARKFSRKTWWHIRSILRFFWKAGFNPA